MASWSFLELDSRLPSGLHNSKTEQLNCRVSNVNLLPGVESASWAFLELDSSGSQAVDTIVKLNNCRVSSVNLLPGVESFFLDLPGAGF